MYNNRPLNETILLNNNHSIPKFSKTFYNKTKESLNPEIVEAQNNQRSITDR